MENPKKNRYNEMHPADLSSADCARSSAVAGQSYWTISLGFTEFLPSFTVFFLALLRFAYLYRVLPSFFIGLIVFYWVLLGFAKSLSVLPVFVQFYLVLLSFTGFFRGFIGFYWVLLCFTGFYWVLLGFTGFYQV